MRVRRGPALARIALDFADWDRRHGGCRGAVRVAVCCGGGRDVCGRVTCGGRRVCVRDSAELGWIGGGGGGDVGVGVGVGVGAARVAVWRWSFEDLDGDLSRRPSLVARPQP